MSSVIALDIGHKRIGVAAAAVQAKIAQPLKTMQVDDHIIEKLVRLAEDQQAVALVIGFPRGMDGQKTAQTEAVEAFGRRLEQHVSVPVYWQDESVTSRQAEAELEQRGKPYAKGDIDALAATYILEDFLREHPEALA